MTVPPSVAGTTFATGDVAAGRFRILRYLARGGMGEVYEAQDELLDTRVALKTLRAHVADDAQALERFRREILFARQVTHPNVCRIFDVFHHRRTQDPSEPPVTFLTMELLPGETLAERLRARGRMSPAEALPIVAQVVSALSAAHKAGIVHRDVKSGNVMLVPTQAGEDRAVVTDFGLARAVDPGEGSSTGGEMVGTSAYMAPEQVKGGAITPAADIYALGVVLYEIVTGARPFSGDSPVAIALQRLEQPPAAPSSHVPELDPAWERTILHCLQREPAARFAAVEDVLGSLSGAPTRLSGITPRGSRGKRWLWPTLIGAALLAAVVVGWRWVGAPRPIPDLAGTQPAEAATRRAVAVLGLKSLSGRPESAWLSTAFAEMLATELSAAARLRTIPGENVARMKADLALPEAEALSGATLARIRTHVGADLVVLGSYLAVESRGGAALRLDLRVQDAVAGETIASIAETGTEAEILELVARCGRRLRASLGADESREGAATGEQRPSLPGNPEAVRLYTEGLEKLRLFDPLGAAEVLERAVAADPAFPLARLALSDAWTTLGYDERARAQARQAFENSRNLPREERLVVEVRYYETTHEWEKAIEVSRVLFGFFPDQVEYGLSLARCQMAAEQDAEALKTLEALRGLPLIPADQARLNIVDARLAQGLSDYRRELLAAQRAVGQAEQVGARLLVATARELEAWAQFRLGQPDAALQAYESARRNFSAVHDRSGLARVLGSVGLVLRDRADIAGARRHHEQSLALFRELGDRGGRAWALTHLGIVAGIEGDFAAARSAYEESLVTFRELADTPGVLRSLLELGGLALQQAELPTARRHFAEALATSAKLGARRLEARALCGLGDVQLASAELAEARQSYERSRSVREATGERAGVAESRLALATLALAEGRTGEAEAAARQSAEEFERQQMSDMAASARALQATALLADGHGEEGAAAADQAQRLSRDSTRLVTRLTVALAAARVASARGDSRSAERTLLDVSRGAERARLPALDLEARLTLAQLELARGATTAGRERLERVRHEATSRGLRLIARRADAVRSR